jgi:hypothetical protein
MKGLAAVARPQTAGLPQAKSPAKALTKAPARRASQTKKAGKAGAKKKRRAA